MVVHDKLSVKKIMITGASSGIGANLANEIAQHGGIPILIARSVDKLHSLHNSIYKYYQIDCPVYELDLREERDIKQKVNQIFAEQGSVDALINNAGAGKFAYVQHIEPSEVDWMFSLNVKGLMYITKLMINHFMENDVHGHIVNIASQAGKMATPKSAVYAASKHAVLGFTNALRLEMKEKHIFVTAVNLGPVKTNFFANADPEGTYQKNVARYMLDPQNVARKITSHLFTPKREINMPWWMEWGSRLYGLCPGMMERLLRSQFNKK
ncbi:SDR family oxidoreductase [Virgibacillus sp. 179-BFC.A HS]|uniref:SDR family oxidoreductase n=1 Tax=Tigheibacillus jepli TaxID=3035914 RepID=A0ABU5CJG3_9BACI|nr:SDR family oxidoreductase [Virgibacillus sp. 179-BFC.A HS]MDY0405640.1 SDR family oxidoreductase [Virgibacillus sp. 179-BFC.A HS]